MKIKEFVSCLLLSRRNKINIGYMIPRKYDAIKFPDQLCVRNNTKKKQFKVRSLLQGRNWSFQKPAQRNKFSAFSDRYCSDTVLLDFCIM